MIGNVYTDQAELLSTIANLHNGNQAFHVDLTYGNGSFWKKLNLYMPHVCADLTYPEAGQGSIVRSYVDGQLVGCSVLGQNVQCDVRALPFRKGSVRSIVFDPPFLHAPGKDSIMGKRFGGYPSQNALNTLYTAAAQEIRQVLAHGGLLIWKCQDVVESGHQVRQSQAVYSICRRELFVDLDKFVLVKEHRMVGWNQHIQKHARKQESYFWVFRKP